MYDGLHDVLFGGYRGPVAGVACFCSMVLGFAPGKTQKLGVTQHLGAGSSSLTGLAIVVSCGWDLTWGQLTLAHKLTLRVVGLFPWCHLPCYHLVKTVLSPLWFQRRRHRPHWSHFLMTRIKKKKSWIHVLKLTEAIWVEGHYSQKRGQQKENGDDKLCLLCPDLAACGRFGTNEAVAAAGYQASH